MKKMFLLLLIIAAFACDKDGEYSCVDKMVKKKGMIPYQGEDPGCRTFLIMRSYKGVQYFDYGNHCADMISDPFDCFDNKICENPDSKSCQNYFKASPGEIVGITPP